MRSAGAVMLGSAVRATCGVGEETTAERGATSTWCREGVSQLLATSRDQSSTHPERFPFSSSYPSETGSGGRYA